MSGGNKESMDINPVAKKYIESIQNLSTELNPLVVVRCITYNHEPYIRDALEGFVNQKTKFPFIVIVHDDASTDGTADIIREYAKKYPDIIKPIFEEENQYSKKNGSITRIMKAACDATGAKYIAMCEGDDYWIEPSKLQRQVDFLESHNSIGMCYTNFDIIYQDKGSVVAAVFDSKPKEYQSQFSTLEEFIIRAAYVCPPSWLIRRELLPSQTFGSLDGTFVYFAHFLASSKVAYLNFRSCVYRILSESASHTNDFSKRNLREKNLLATQKTLIDRYELDQSVLRSCIYRYYERNLRYFIENKREKEIEKARAILKTRNLKSSLLFLMNDLGLTFMIPLIKKIKFKIYKS